MMQSLRRTVPAIRACAEAIVDGKTGNQAIDLQGLEPYWNTKQGRDQIVEALALALEDLSNFKSTIRRAFPSLFGKRYDPNVVLHLVACPYDSTPDGEVMELAEESMVLLVLDLQIGFYIGAERMTDHSDPLAYLRRMSRTSPAAATSAEIVEHERFLTSITQFLLHRAERSNMNDVVTSITDLCGGRGFIPDLLQIIRVADQLNIKINDLLKDAVRG